MEVVITRDSKIIFSLLMRKYGETFPQFEKFFQFVSRVLHGEYDTQSAWETLNICTIFADSPEKMELPWWAKKIPFIIIRAQIRRIIIDEALLTFIHKEEKIEQYKQLQKEWPEIIRIATGNNSFVTDFEEYHKKRQEKALRALERLIAGKDFEWSR